MSQILDGPGPVRKGEELDTASLRRFLVETFGPSEDPLHVEQFREGHSNLTYLVRFGDRELVLRRPPFASKVKTAHDMNREYTVLSGICEVYPFAPRPAAFCDDESILGAKFYLMERIKGVIPRSRPPQGVTLPPETVRQCCSSFVRNLATLHQLDHRAAGLTDLYRPGWYAQRQVFGWAERYERSKTDEIPAIETTITWLKERVPEDTGYVLIHNDYKFDNLVLDPENLARIIGVLDWEMATIGDPLMDLGSALGYWVEAKDPPGLQAVQCFLTSLPGSATRIELAEEYARLTGRDISNILFYYVFSLLKIAVIVQQIYYRYMKGSTKDERFASLIFVVRFLGDLAVAAVEKQRV
jgi:aminoglycoside phosphotransferase (APT) family kinase protein